MKKYIGIILFIIGILFLVIFKLIGSHVSKDGILHEPFFLIPTGEFLVIIGVVLIIFYYFRNKK
jgi:hypothetical protein